VQNPVPEPQQISQVQVHHRGRVAVSVQFPVAKPEVQLVFGLNVADLKISQKIAQGIVNATAASICSSLPGTLHTLQQHLGNTT
jgi:hypothetical protein